MDSNMSVKKFHTIAYPKVINKEERSIVAYVSQLSVLHYNYFGKMIVNSNNLIIEENAWNLDIYRKHPFLLLSQAKKTLRMGKILWIKVYQENLMFKAQFADNEIIDEIFRLAKNTKMAIFSIEFIPRELGDKTIFELVGISLIGLPSYPTLLSEAYNENKIVNKELKYQIKNACNSIYNFPSKVKEQIQWVKELVNNPEGILFFKNKAYSYNTTVIELQKLFFKQRGVCALCGDKLYFSRNTHLDHIISKKYGGENNINNYQFVCAKCNYAKRELSSREFIIMCIKIATKNKYILSKAETMRILDSIYKQQRTKGEIERRKMWQNNYLEQLNEGDENFSNILDDKVDKYTNELFKKYKY